MGLPQDLFKETTRSIEPKEAEATEQDLRRKRQNTFAPEVPRAWIIQRGGRAALRAEMRQLT